MGFVTDIKTKYLDKKLALVKEVKKHKEKKLKAEAKLLKKEKQIREAGKVHLTAQESRLLNQEKERHKKAVEERNRKIKENTEKIKKLGKGFMKVVDSFDDKPRRRTKPRPTKKTGKSRGKRA